MTATPRRKSAASAAPGLGLLLSLTAFASARPAVVLPLSAEVKTMPAASLDQLITQARRYDARSFRFTPPTAHRLAQVERLIEEMATHLDPAGPTDHLRRLASAAGLELVVAGDSAAPIWVLHEPGLARAGDGLYAFRPGGMPLCIQAPHTFFDEGTGELAQATWQHLGAACLAINTVHRHALPAVGRAARPEDAPADVAHADATVFAAVTRALLRTRRWPIVQLHGFGPRESLPAAVAAVVSSGGRAGPAHDPAARLRAALRTRLPGEVWLYGAETLELGATGNVQGKAARQVGVLFLHLELSAETRRALRASAAQPLAEAIRAVLGATR